MRSRVRTQTGLFRWIGCLAALAFAAQVHTEVARAQDCAGDCDGDGQVSVAEVLAGVGIALGESAVQSCAASDENADGAVRVPELTRATAAHLSSCGAANPPAAPRAGAGPVGVTVGTAAGLPGERPTFDVTLETSGLDVAGVQLDIAFSPLTPIAARTNGRPDCWVNPAINKDGTSFASQPPGCSLGTSCTAIRGLVLALDNVDPIPDGSVLFTCRVSISPSAANGTYPLTTSNEGTSDPSGNALVTFGVDGAVIVGPPTVCGDNLVEGDEQCDDGNAAGGDGCAANCTQESTRRLNVAPSFGRVVIQTQAIPIVMDVGGTIDFRTGARRLTDPAGSIPVVAKADDLRFDPIRVTGLVCACIRGIERPAFGSGNAAQGTIACGAQGLAGADYLTGQDHNISDVDPTCATGSVEGPSGKHPGVCNGMPSTSFLGAGPTGSALIQHNVAIGLLPDGGACSTAGAPPGRPCPYPDYGPDCQPCTGDDLDQGAPMLVPLTTGTGGAEVLDANNSAGIEISKFAICFGIPCDTEETGAPFDCGVLQSDPNGGFDGVVLAAAVPVLDWKQIGDAVTTFRLANGAPPVATGTPTSTVTRTVTPTRTNTRTATVSATPTVLDAPATLILRRAKLRADMASRPGRNDGWLRVEGLVNTNAPFGGLIEDVQSSGLSLRITTAGGVNVALSWDAAACRVAATGRGPRIFCEASDAGGHRKIVFRPTITPNMFEMNLLARRLTFAPPLTADPVQVLLSTRSFGRRDDIGDCVVRGSRSHVESCREAGILPTQTATPTQSGTATRTETPTRTATPPATGTWTPTPVVVPTVELGERVFSVEPGTLLSGPDLPGSGMFTSGLGGANASNWISPGPLVLVGGLPNADGAAPLSLKEDVTLTLQIIDGSFTCLRLLAAGSTGSIDCDGGTPYDIQASQPAGDVGAAFDLQTGLGAPAGPGNAVLLVMQQVQQVGAAGFTSCEAVAYNDPPQLFGYTTALASAIKGGLRLDVAGEPFDCAQWQVEDSTGALAAPIPAWQPPVGDVASVFRLDDAGSVTIGIGHDRERLGLAAQRQLHRHPASGHRPGVEHGRADRLRNAGDQLNLRPRVARRRELLRLGAR